MTTLSSKYEPTIWSHDTGQQIPCCDRCQLTITWISKIKEVSCKPRLHVSVNLLARVWPPSCTTLLLPSSPSTTSHDNHEYGALLGGPLAAGALLTLGCERGWMCPRGMREQNLLAWVSWFVVPVGDLTGLSNAAGCWWIPPFIISLS